MGTGTPGEVEVDESRGTTQPSADLHNVVAAPEPPASSHQRRAQLLTHSSSSTPRNGNISADADATENDVDATAASDCSNGLHSNGGGSGGSAMLEQPRGIEVADSRGHAADCGEVVIPHIYPLGAFAVPAAVQIVVWIQVARTAPAEPFEFADNSTRGFYGRPAPARGACGGRTHG